MPKTIVHTITDEASQAAAAAAGAEALRAGKLVGFPTETVYGIAVDASNAAALQRLRDLKDRPARPFSVHLGRPEQLSWYVRQVPDEARRLIERAWPGPVTLVLAVEGGLARDDWNTPQLAEALCYEGFIGLRCPSAPASIAMLSQVDAPVVAPSANLAGQPSPRSGRDVIDALDGRIDLLLDAGPTELGTDSTIVRITPGDIQVLREGAVSPRAIRGLIRRRILFVCTGNTCRSPMAAGLARKRLAERLGVRTSQLGDRLIEVISAGAFAADGAPATEEAVRAAAALGASIGRHRSRRLTAELIRSCDVVFCMTQGHVDQVLRLAPGQGDKIHLLDGDRDIADPIGGGGDVYLTTASQIDRALRTRMDEGQL